MHIEIIKCLQDNYSYLILDNTNNAACVIDPGEAKPIIDYIEKKNINLKFILNTHHHRDHVNGNLEIKKNLLRHGLEIQQLYLSLLVIAF